MTTIKRLNHFNILPKRYIALLRYATKAIVVISINNNKYTKHGILTQKQDCLLFRGNNAKITQMDFLNVKRL